MVENVIPYIGGEEEKSEQEPLRIWGHLEGGVIVKAKEPVITCQCVRVPVLNGHTAAAFVKFRKKASKEQLIEKLVNFKGLPQELELPSAPKAVYPVHGGGQSSAGQDGCRFRKRNGRIDRPFKRGHRL